jgi:diacylglycerol kinase (ATP)
MERTKKKLLFVINPIAGTGDNRQVETLISTCLDLNRFDYEVFYTQHPEHASSLEHNLNLEGLDALIAVGGDGTIREVAKNLINKSIPLGIIPMGSGNGLARHLHIPMRPRQAIELINKWNVRPMDTASINNHFFVNVAGVGFDAEVSRKFSEKKRRGFLAYLKVTLTAFLRYQEEEYVLILDGREIRTTAFLVAIANSSQYGNNAFIAPHASTRDGFLDICIIKPFSFLQVPTLTYRLFNKTIEQHPKVSFEKAKNVIVMQSGKNAHFDGDYFESGNELTVRTVPKSLHVLV